MKIYMSEIFQYRYFNKVMLYKQNYDYLKNTPERLSILPQKDIALPLKDLFNKGYVELIYNHNFVFLVCKLLPRLM